MIKLSTKLSTNVDKYVDNLGERRITTKLRITANTTERLLSL